MKALVFSGIEKVSCETLADPGLLSETDAIVEVHACAICGSDLHVYHGRETGIDMHTVMGHEFAGTIVEIGKSVRALKKGDRVASPFTTSCGDCWYCRTGLTCRCEKSGLFGWVENGNGLHGGQAGFVRVPLADSTLVRIPETISMELGVLAGDIIPTGFHCARRAFEISNYSPKSVGVIGCGPVGLMAILGAVNHGAEKIFAFDKVPSRLALAAKFGAVPVEVKSDLAECIGQVVEETEGRGLDAALEAVGSGPSLQLAYDLIRPGGVISAVGVCTEMALPFSPVDAYNKNITYSTGRCPARQLMPEILGFVESGAYPFAEIISHRLKLEDGPDAYERFASREPGMMKVILETT